MKKETKTNVVCCTRRQKVLGLVALVGLFACGLMVGITFNSNAKSQNSAVAENAAVVENQQATPEQPCQVVESLLLKKLYSENTDNSGEHRWNLSVYKRLAEYGCPENAKKYQDMIAREEVILKALDGESTQLCEDTENMLQDSLVFIDGYDSDSRIARAKIYANLAERGCPEHAQYYTDLAVKELTIARALSEDKFDKQETIDVVETYKRLEMKQAAAEVLDKAKKLTDPAIDFILQVQKIIEE